MHITTFSQPSINAEAPLMHEHQIGSLYMLGFSLLFMLALTEAASMKPNNDSTDGGMFHNSNRHCLGSMTSSTIHPSGL